MKSAGFTLIELLIVITIMALFAATGSYLSVQARNNAALRSSSDLLKSHLIEARMNALYGKKPRGCTGTFAGVEFSKATDNFGYTIQSKCNPDTADATDTLVSLRFDNPNVNFIPTTIASFTFSPLLQLGVTDNTGAQVTTDITLALTNNSPAQNPEVVVTRTGDVHTPALAATPTESHRDGQDWCQNHGGIALQIDHDIAIGDWNSCLAWCDAHMSASLPLCQYNSDAARNCWVNYSPGGPGGNVHDCNWIPGNYGHPPPYGAWWAGLE